MIVNKKLDRFRQWAGERMGGEVKTNTSDDFKALEQEMVVRHEGMEKLHKSMTVYIKSMSKRNEGEDKEKTLPPGYLGSTMISHSDDFDPDSEFGSCLAGLGRANERIARIQEGYVANATSSWLESVERSLAQMKEYQAARKKLETRRLAYDTSLAKMQKAKKEDFRVEEELRSQKAKYEESSEDVYRRMEDIKEAEVDSVADLTAFLEAELSYYDRCRDVLLQLKRDWPANNGSHEGRDHRRGPRNRSSIAHSFSDRCTNLEEEPEPEPKMTIRSSRVTSASHSIASSPRRETGTYDFSAARPPSSRSSTIESQNRNYREDSPVSMPRLSRAPTDSSVIQAGRSHLRPVRRTGHDGFGDGGYDSPHDGSSSPERSYGERSVSPATSYGSIPSRNTSWSTAESNYSGNMKKAPPPPPPSRSKKPPPPPPMKRSALSTSDVHQY